MTGLLQFRGRYSIQEMTTQTRTKIAATNKVGPIKLDCLMLLLLDLLNQHVRSL